MQIQLTNQKGTFDLMQLVTAIKWSGELQQAARRLDVTLLSTPRDSSIPVVDCPLGSVVQMQEGGAFFEGFVTSRPRSTEGSTITLSCYDRGFYLKQNRELYKFEETTAEAATARIAGDFGIAVGHLAATGVPLTRLFLTGRESLYDIIATMYTLASRSTGEQYHIGFRGDRLYVTEKKPDDRTLIIQARSNLIAASVTESIERMVNTVKIYDEQHCHVRTEQDAQAVRSYGRLQEVLIQNQKDDRFAEAREKITEQGVSQKITIDNLGNVANVTGGCVVVREPYTGLYGLFYIDSDTHEWKRGQYFNKLVVNYKKTMDEKEAGTLPNADGAKTVGSTGSTGSTADDNWYRYNIFDGTPRQQKEE